MRDRSGEDFCGTEQKVIQVHPATETALQPFGSTDIAPLLHLSPAQNS